MPIDIDLVRAHKGGDPSLCARSEERRGREDADSRVRNIVDVDMAWRLGRQKLDNRKKERAALSKSIRDKVRANLSPDVEKERSSALKEEILAAEKEADTVFQRLREQVKTIGNLLDERVPAEDSELKSWWPSEMAKENAMMRANQKSHTELCDLIDGVDTLRGTSVSGKRGYFIKGPLLRLKLALERYAIDFLCARSSRFIPIYTPYMMEPAMLNEAVQLNEFSEMIYSTTDDKYLIATAEQPLSAMHQSEWLQENQLPIYYAGTSTCFRKEAGNTSSDMGGLFRVHQFEKIEQFALCEPKQSDEIHHEFLENAEVFLQSLNIPYRVVAICGKDLNSATSLKYDIEAWFPSSRSYREVVSCSNCTDYLSRALDIRCGSKKMIDHGRKIFCHMVNSTLCAVQRLLCVMLETFQSEDGVLVPQVLQPYFVVGGNPLKQQLISFAPTAARKLDRQNATKSMRTAARKKDDFLKKQECTHALNEKNRKLVATTGKRAIKKKKETDGSLIGAIVIGKGEKSSGNFSEPLGAGRLNLFSIKGMNWLDERLGSQSYLMGKDGYVASAEDFVVYNALTFQFEKYFLSWNMDKHANISRWYKNIHAASTEERESWPAAVEHVLSGSVSYHFDLTFDSVQFNELKRDRAQGYIRYASKLFRQEQLSDSILAYEAGISLDPTNNSAKKGVAKCITALLHLIFDTAEWSKVKNGEGKEVPSIKISKSSPLYLGFSVIFAAKKRLGSYGTILAKFDKILSQFVEVDEPPSHAQFYSKEGIDETTWRTKCLVVQ